MVKYRAVAVAVAVAVSGGGAVAVAVAGLTKRFFNHIQKDFLINVWGYWLQIPLHFILSRVGVPCPPRSVPSAKKSCYTVRWYN